MAEEDQVERLFATVLDRFGRLDILINNVGMKLLTPSTLDADVAAPGMGIYVAKAGLEMLPRVLATELAPPIHAAGEACGGLCRSEASSIICGGLPTGITGGAPGEYSRQTLDAIDELGRMTEDE